MPSLSDKRKRRPTYPNKWLEDGNILTWYIQDKEWGDGKLDIARLLGFNSHTEENNSISSNTSAMEESLSSSPSSSIVLFVCNNHLNPEK
eukprot:1485318-Ditylum_brightwellii.AAC.1